MSLLSCNLQKTTLLLEPVLRLFHFSFLFDFEYVCLVITSAQKFIYSNRLISFTLTLTNYIILFVRYSAPTDIYSLGIVFLELLTLHLVNPFMSFTSLALDNTEPITYEAHLGSCLAKVPAQYTQDTRDLLREMLNKV